MSKNKAKTSNPIVDKAVADLNKKYGAGSINRLGDMGGAQTVPKFSSGIAHLDLALGGGWPFGRMIEIYGPSGSGKTSLSLFALSNLQKMGKKVAFIDLENALDPMLAEMYGVDTDDLYLAYPMTGEAAFGIIEGLASTGEFGGIVLDSVSAVLPSAEREEDIGKPVIALQARLMSQVLRRLVGVCGKTGTTVFFINQIREKMVMYGNPETVSGGRALSFYASVRADVRIDEFIGENGKSQKSRDNAIGHKTKVKIVKNKVAKPFQEGYYSLIYGEGFDKYYDIFNMAVHTGVVNKGGAWYSYKDFKWQGGDNVLTEWKNNPLLFDEIATKTYSAIQAEGQGQDTEKTEAEITSDEDNVEEK